MDCADCAAKLEQNIGRLRSVESVKVNFATGNLVVDHEINESEIVQAVEKSGYKVINKSARAARRLAAGYQNKAYCYRRNIAGCGGGIKLAGNI